MHRMNPLAPPCREVPDDERGAILVIWAVALAAIMGLVAMAVDLGNIGQTKQHTQNASDAAVLAGVVDLSALVPNGNLAIQEAQAVSDAETYLLDNYSLSSPNWNSCGSFPSGVTSYPGADCFGFFTTGGSPNVNGMAVQMPPQTVRASFGKADGFSGAVVSSTAYASIQTAQSSYVLPFAYGAGGGTGLQCLKTGSGKQAGSCTGFATGSGQFGTIDSPRYVIFPGSSSSSGNNATTQTDVVLGLDHQLNLYQGGKEICDEIKSPPNCPYYNNTAPYNQANYVAPSTGQAASDLNGLFTTVTSPDGTCTFAPRLDHPDGFIATSSCSADEGSASGVPNNTVLPSSIPLLTSDTFGSTYDLNGQSIEAFLNGAGTTFTSSCSSSLPPNASSVAIDAKTGATYAWAAYDQCLANLLAAYNPATTGAIFQSSIEQSPRFGEVPLVTSASGGNAEPIVGWDDVYLDLMFGQNGTVSAVLAWIFPQGAVTPTSTSGQGVGGYFGGDYVANLCSYTAAGTNC